MNIRKIAIALVFSSFFVMNSFAAIEYATPESQGVKSSSIIKYLEECDRNFNAKGLAGSMHGVVILRHGKIIAEGSWKPFNTLEDTHILYSHSKSFTSTAIGLLVYDGKLNINERVVDIFPEESKGIENENLKQLRVVDLLTMNIGAAKDHCLPKDSDNWVKSFFTKAFVKKPGTCFKYDSDATFMLSAIVQKRSGKDMMEFLKERLFDKIGIKKAWSTYSPEGIACGGWGMNMTTREMARFGQLYLQKGYWNGELVINPRWIELASASHTASGWKDIAIRALGTGSDWEQGYGFQFWRCMHDAYRADGAGGQLTVIFPKQDMVVSIHAGLKAPALELELLYKHLIGDLSEKALPENPEDYKRLKNVCENLQIKPLAGTFEEALKYCDVDFAIEKNRCGLESAKLYRKDGKQFLWFVANGFVNEIEVGLGHWAPGTVQIHDGKVEWLGAILDAQKAVTSGAYEKENSWYRVRTYLTGTTTFIEFRFSEKNSVPVLEGRVWSLGGCKFSGSIKGKNLE
jgi:CubicO group peptidase (beta-lactamase class C family)